MMVGSVLSFWDGPFSGAMLVLGRVTVDASKNFSSISVAGGSRNIFFFLSNDLITSIQFD